LPGRRQFILRREVDKRIRDEFAKNGIECARPRVMVLAPPGVTPIETAVALPARTDVP
jgi:hypothetical protein